MDKKDWIVAATGGSSTEIEAPLFHFLNDEKRLVGVGVVVDGSDRTHAAVTIDDDVVKSWGIELTFLRETDPITMTERFSIVSQPQEIHTEETINKVFMALQNSGIAPNDAQAAITYMQNAGILFRERNTESLWA